MRVYLDNAATTAVHPEVAELMADMMRNSFGNPSSIHSFGREVRSKLEESRKTVARLLNTVPSNIFFTSGGTEANNTALRCSISDMGIQNAITSPIEHHAVLHTLEDLAERKLIDLTLLEVDKKGRVDLDQLDKVLSNSPRTLVSLMHANNEIGTVLPLEEAASICRAHNAVFHSDTVQTMGHFIHDLEKLKVDFLSCAAHKFHGPKGVGFLYMNLQNVHIRPFITGGAQERNMRGGTENVYGIVGLAKALEIAYRDMEDDRRHISALRERMKQSLLEAIPDLQFNGDPDENSLYTVLNVSFPPSDFSEMLLFSLDIAGIAASGGSACSSGSEIGSHVLRGIHADPDRPAVRFSFSRYNTIEEIDYCVEKLKELYLVKA